MCPGGTTSNAGASSCVSCSSACLSCYTTSTNCTSCKAGYYKSGNSCKQCAAGYYSNANATSCIKCVSGYYSLAGASGCNISCKNKYGQNCAECNEYGCVSCESGYSLKNGKCEGGYCHISSRVCRYYCNIGGRERYYTLLHSGIYYPEATYKQDWQQYCHDEGWSWSNNGMYSPDYQCEQQFGKGKFVRAEAVYTHVRAEVECGYIKNSSGKYEKK